MLNFLKQSRRIFNSKEPICIVLGNESCDLDSAVCAISLAYFYQKMPNCLPKASGSCNFLPILNIPKSDYPLKTEVKYLFNKYLITDDLLTFRDELTDDLLKSNQCVLVDHHVSPWSTNAIAIYDHRPQDTVATIPKNCEVHLQLVGSCATLIGELFIKGEVLGELEMEILHLLRSTIVLDTVNFSKESARSTPKDVEVCSALEDALTSSSTCLSSRKELFDCLVEARADVSSLTAAQLLRKDLKVLTSNKDTSLKIAIPGFPLPVQQFILKANAERDILQFAEEHKCAVILLMGMFVKPEDGSVHRDLGLINISNSLAQSAIKERLETLEEPNLSIESYKDCNFMNGFFYKQGNIRATRKHILPVVKVILDN